MKGYPKKLNTKEDYEYVRTHFPKEEWQQDWQNLLDTEYDWVEVDTATDASYLRSDSTHKVLVDEGEGSDTTYIQYELQLIPTCKLLQLGFTEEYVKSVLAE